MPKSVNTRFKDEYDSVKPRRRMANTENGYGYYEHDESAECAAIGCTPVDAQPETVTVEISREQLRYLQAASGYIERLRLRSRDERIALDTVCLHAKEAFDALDAKKAEREYYEKRRDAALERIKHWQGRVEEINAKLEAL